MTVLYLLCLAASITTLAALLLRPHRAPAPTSPTTPQSPAMATDAARLDALGTLLRAAADQITTYRPAA